MCSPLEIEPLAGCGVWVWLQPADGVVREGTRKLLPDDFYEDAVG